MPDNANWLRTRLAANGIPAGAIEAALAGYRAPGVRHAPVGPTRTPTLFIWGDQDDTVARQPLTGEFIAAPYQFVAFPGVGHYAADRLPEQVNALLLGHLKRNPVGSH